MDEDQTPWAWVAGILDAAGVFSIKPLRMKKGTPIAYLPHITITTRQYTLVSAIQFAMEHGAILEQEDARYRYQIDGRAAIVVARLSRPFLRVKTREADLFTQFPFMHKREGPIPPDTLTLQRTIYEALQQHA
jgi:hypothetical protein